MVREGAEAEVNRINLEKRIVHEDSIREKPDKYRDI